MESFILFGIREHGGFHHVQRDQLKILPDGVLTHVDDGNVYVTSTAQQELFRDGRSVGPPSWEHLLNDLVTVFVVQGFASDSRAQDLFIMLGEEERKAIASADVRGICHQRVRTAVLGFNLLAIGSTWRPAISSGLPYWNRNWVDWCDKYIAEIERGRAQYEQIGSFWEARSLEAEGESLEAVRAAFVASPKAAATPQPSGGCFVATSVYGSYDAPQVLVLRRWRDESLTRTSVGRRFIRFYYAISPTLVRLLGEQRWFSVPTRRMLDSLVRYLTRISQTDP